MSSALADDLPAMAGLSTVASSAFAAWGADHIQCAGIVRISVIGGVLGLDIPSSQHVAIKQTFYPSLGQPETSDRPDRAGWSQCYDSPVPKPHLPATYQEMGQGSNDEERDQRRDRPLSSDSCGLPPPTMMLTAYGY